jgi:hypothetical protein
LPDPVEEIRRSTGHAYNGAPMRAGVTYYANRERYVEALEDRVRALDDALAQAVDYIESLEARRVL